VWAHWSIFGVGLERVNEDVTCTIPAALAAHRKKLTVTFTRLIVNKYKQETLIFSPIYLCGQAITGGEKFILSERQSWS
jgi:hypothetical protein